ncbi:MAG: hypothetical protein K0S33_2931 [Bacteroidetes bacterium]|jgi:hypothetical protein|nr:hypothetical protein [Bacteroidota bacterium]
MKNYIYLTILAVAFLCSCKSNSFLSQRYTHFGHSSKKSEQQKPAVTEPKEQVSIAAAPAKTEIAKETPKPAEELASEKENTAHNKSANAKADENETSTTNGLRAEQKSKSLPGIVIHSSQRLLKAAQDQQRAASQRGLLFGVINFLFSIIILVVVVALIVWLVLVLVAV